MKIEPKHNTKLPSYAVVGAACVAASMLAGCMRLVPPVETPTAVELAGETTTEIIRYSGELTECEDCYEDPIESVSPTSLGGSVADYCDVNSDQFRLFMDKIDEIEETFPGEYKFNISVTHEYRDDNKFYVLTAVNGDDIHYFMVLNGELIHKLEAPFDVYVDYMILKDYEDIKQMPFLIDTEKLSHYEVTVNGRERVYTTPFADSIEDGDYKGEIIGVSEDGTRAVFVIGKPVLFEYFPIQRLAEGEEIGYMGFVRGHDEKELSYRSPVPVSSPSKETNDEFTVTRYENHKGLTYDAYLMCGLTYWLDDVVIIELPLAEDCKVFSLYEPHEHPDDMPPDWEENGSKMTDTFFFKEFSAKNERYPNDNGWYSTSADVHSVVITDGVVTEMELKYYDW